MKRRAARPGRCTCSRRPTPSASTRCGELVELGVAWVWMGLESPRSQYAKLNGIDTLRADARAAVARHPRAGLHHRRPGAPHARRTSSAEIEHAVAHDADFHQFMLYTPVPGTPLYAEMQARGAAAGGRRPGRHPRAVQVQLPASGHLARRVEVDARLRRSAATSSGTARACSG